VGTLRNTQATHGRGEMLGRSKERKLSQHWRQRNNRRHLLSTFHYLCTKRKKKMKKKRKKTMTMMVMMMMMMTIKAKPASG
jgi:adenylyl- and sulfurtransferase ThiI